MLALAVSLYVWFLFSVYPKERISWVQKEKRAAGDATSHIAADLIDLVTLNNYTSIENRITSFDGEFNERLAKYLKAVNGGLPTYHFNGFDQSSKTESDLRSLFVQFLRGYDHFLEKYKEASSNNNNSISSCSKIMGISSRWSTFWRKNKASIIDWSVREREAVSISSDPRSKQSGKEQTGAWWPNCSFNRYIFSVIRINHSITIVSPEQQKALPQSTGVSESADAIKEKAKQIEELKCEESLAKM